MNLLITPLITLLLITQAICGITKVTSEEPPKEEEVWDCGHLCWPDHQGHYPPPEEMDKCCVDYGYASHVKCDKGEGTVLPTMTCRYAKGINVVNVLPCNEKTCESSKEEMDKCCQTGYFDTYKGSYSKCISQPMVAVGPILRCIP